MPTSTKKTTTKRITKRGRAPSKVRKPTAKLLKELERSALPVENLRFLASASTPPELARRKGERPFPPQDE